MTRPLRRAHFAIWIAAALVLGFVLASGLVSRRTTTPVNSSLDWGSLSK